MDYRQFGLFIGKRFPYEISRGNPYFGHKKFNI